MSRGRKTKPPLLGIIKGPHAYGSKPKAPAGPRLKLAPPDWLVADAEAANVWKSLAPALDKQGFVTSLDADAIAFYCLAVANCRRASASINKLGMTYKAKSGLHKINPAVSVLRENIATATTLAKEIGATPLARKRLGQPLSVQPRNKLESFVQSKRDDRA